MENKKKLETYPPGTTLIKENDLSRKMFIIRKGKVKVYKNYFGKKITLATLGPGEIFGELSFFDAAPRSATVETITEVTANIIEGEKSIDQIENLPSWVTKVLRTTFYRFREMDQKLTLLQSMTDFQKKTGIVDTIAETIYTELLRFNKMLELVYIGRKEQEEKDIEYKSFQKEIEDTLGKKFINQKTYFKTLIEHNFLYLTPCQGEQIVEVDFEHLSEFNAYLSHEAEKGRYLLLDNNSISVLRKIVGYLDQDVKTKEDEIIFQKEQNKLNKTPNFEKSIQELAKKKILAVVDNDLVVNVDNMHNHYVYQSIIHNFNHTVIHV